MSSLNDVLAVILGGGVGKRLYPLTRQRAKPAVPIAGKYRLIDVPISNCINSGINRIAVLTQFNSVSLHRHITQTYTFDDFHHGWVQILAAEQTPRSTDWYQGTADAVRKQLLRDQGHWRRICADPGRRPPVPYGLRDHGGVPLGKPGGYHRRRQPVAAQEASRFGLLKRNPARRIPSFVEKPRDPDVLAQFVSRDDPERPYLGSMGIYFFNTDVLVDLLESSSFEDFGGQIIPNAIGSHRVMRLRFRRLLGRYRDNPLFLRNQPEPGTPGPALQFLRSGPPDLHPAALPARIGDRWRHVEKRLAGRWLPDPRSRDQRFDRRPAQPDRPGRAHGQDHLYGRRLLRLRPARLAFAHPIGIGPNCQIEGAIIDKNVRIGEGVVIRSSRAAQRLEDSNWVVQDGIVVIPKDTILYPGTYIGPE